MMKCGWIQRIFLMNITSVYHAMKMVKRLCLQSQTRIGEVLWQPRVFVSSLRYLIKLSSLFPTYIIYNFCRLIKLSSSYQTFIIFSPFLIYLLFYVIYVPYKCTCTTHQTTKLSLSSYGAHALCANRRFQLNRRLWPSCHFGLWGIEVWPGVFY